MAEGGRSRTSPCHPHCTTPQCPLQQLCERRWGQGARSERLKKDPGWLLVCAGSKYSRCYSPSKSRHGAEHIFPPLPSTYKEQRIKTKVASALCSCTSASHGGQAFFSTVFSQFFSGNKAQLAPASEEQASPQTRNTAQAGRSLQPAKGEGEGRSGAIGSGWRRSEQS